MKIDVESLNGVRFVVTAESKCDELVIDMLRSQLMTHKIEFRGFSDFGSGRRAFRFGVEHIPDLKWEIVAKLEKVASNQEFMEWLAGKLGVEIRNDRTSLVGDIKKQLETFESSYGCSEDVRGFCAWLGGLEIDTGGKK